MTAAAPIDPPPTIADRPFRWPPPFPVASRPAAPAVDQHATTELRDGS